MADRRAATAGIERSDQEMLHDYLLAMLGVETAVRATLASGLEQWRELPTAWNADRSGHAKRWASAFGETAVGDTTQYLVAEPSTASPAICPSRFRS